MAKNAGSSVLAALAGIAIGVGVGVLVAPEEGKKTRKKMKKTFDAKTDELKTRINELGEEIKRKSKTAKGSFEENMEHLVSKTSGKAEEVINVLEKKLADLKKANANLQK